MAWDLEFSIYDFFKCLLLAITAFKRSISECEFENQNPKTPNINSLIVKVALHNLWWHVI